jgi:hypothetical protein
MRSSSRGTAIKFPLFALDNNLQAFVNSKVESPMMLVKEIGEELLKGFLKELNKYLNSSQLIG